VRPQPLPSQRPRLCAAALIVAAALGYVGALTGRYTTHQLVHAGWWGALYGAGAATAVLLAMECAGRLRQRRRA
jgi:VIT1/CCC1 family predicted Fe2+/Mn2+ transporter